MSFHGLFAHLFLLLNIFYCLDIPQFEGHLSLSSFRFLMIMNKAAINICVQIFV